jgi:hypothetical protein
MSAEKLRERFQSWVRLLFTSMQSTDKIIVSPSGKSSTNQLPALPIPLELVYRKNDDCGEVSVCYGLLLQPATPYTSRRRWRFAAWPSAMGVGVNLEQEQILA